LSGVAPGPTTQVPVRELLDAGKEHLLLELLGGEAGLDRVITHQRIQKPGLAMAGHTDFIHPGRVQVFGQSEISCLIELTAAERRAVLEPIFAHDITCVALTKGLEVPTELLDLCEQRGVPLLRSPLLSSIFIDRLNHFLDARFAPRITVHGVMVDVLGVGVLLRGPSGIGKSECALDLVMRGHRLVSDDIVEIQCRQGEVLVARGPEIVRSHMEVRGLGIINIAHLFGVGATRQRKRLEMVVELKQGHLGEDCERLGLDQEFTDLMGVPIPIVTIPVVPGRSMANIVEVAARSLLLRLRGLHPAAEIADRLQAAMENPQFIVGRFELDEGDLE
jgi:HPr kinase/phosphorylase